MTEEKDKTRETTETPPEEKGGKEGLTEEQVLAAIENGEWDASFAKVVSQQMVSKDRVEEIVTERLERDRQNRKEEAETEALKEQQRYKELYETEAEKVKNLQPRQAEAERYKAALTAQLDARKKDLKPHIVTLLEKMDPADQLQYLTENAEALGVPASLVRTDDTTHGDPAARQEGESTAADRLEKRLPKLRR